MIKMISEVSNYWQGNDKCLYQSLASAAAADFDVFKVQLYDTSSMGAEWLHKQSHYKLCEFDKRSLKAIGDTVKQVGLEFLVTVFQTHLLDMALKETSNIKIASGQLSDEFKRHLISNESRIKALYISTGMTGNESEINELHDFLSIIDIPEIHVMHCVSLYPPVDTEINMSRIDSLRDVFDDLLNVDIGYSDHGADNVSAMVAASRGVSCIELHFTIAGMYGKTSQIAYTEETADNAIAVFRRMELMQGNGQLKCQPREEAVREKYATRWLTKPTIIEPRGKVINLR